MKKIITFAMAIMLMVTMVPLTAFASSGTDKWDGTADTGWYTANPAATSFTIDTAEELAGLAEIVNAGTDTFEGDTITLTQNLDLASKEWTPIGNSVSLSWGNDPFLGTFDGGNHWISNMKIDNNTTHFSLGLFGTADDTSIPKGATLMNISVLNIYIEGNKIKGGLVGQIRGGKIINCHTSGEIIGGSMLGGLAVEATNAKIDKSSSSVKIYAPTGVGVGGLVGKNSGDNAAITNSYATGDVEGGVHVGGLVGEGSDEGIIENSYATGNVKGIDNVGGLVGLARQRTIKNSYTTGGVEGNDYVGGLVGKEGGTGIIENSYATGNVSGTSNVGGLAVECAAVINSYGNNANSAEGNGTNGNEYTTGKAGATLDEMRTGSFVEKLDSTGNTFGGDPDFNNGFPYLATIPQIMSGDGQTIKQGETLTIKATMPYAEGMGLTTKVGGAPVPADKVTYKEGSTITTLSGEYTANLEVGRYSIEIATLDYGTVNGTFTVTESTPALVPETGDDSNLYGMISVAIISILGVYVVARRRNRV